MPLIQILIALILVGFGLWLVDKLPLDPTIKTIIKGVLILAVVIWLLLMVAPFFSNVEFPRGR